MSQRIAYGAMAVIAAFLVSYAALSGGSGSGPAPPAGKTGPEVGAIAPDFVLTDGVSGLPVSKESLRDSRTMLFFSEGVNCQACMVQAADLEKAGTLERQGIDLVSVSTDSPELLSEAARQYGISTPLLADPTTEMSAAYGMLGHGGMGHPTTNGHAFMLLDRAGKVLWHRAYQEMYVKPARLLRDMRKEAAA